MTIIDANPNFSLPQLNQFVAQQEGALQGPLTAIGNGGGQTKLTIDDLDPSGAPANPSVITVDAIPPGKVPIGGGQVFISGTLTNAAAYKG